MKMASTMNSTDSAASKRRSLTWGCGCCGSDVAAVGDAPGPVRVRAAGGASAAAGEEASAVVVQPTSVMVVVRVRPLVAREKTLRASDAVSVPDARSLVMLEDPSGASKGAGAERSFAFDAVLGQGCSQENVYANTGAIILDKCMQGFNGCIFAYGQTGSGKTFTMEGASNSEGVMPRLSRDLFQRIAELRKQGFTCTVECTYLEIYQETLRDLLSPITVAMLSPTPDVPSAAAQLRGGPSVTPSSPMAAAAADPVIRESRGGDMYVENISTRPLHSGDELQAVITEGTTRRTKGETAMNAVSSRSHAVLTLRIGIRRADDEAGLTLRTSKLHLIDLAGSERADATQATGVRLKEGAKINLSLSALGNVINALTTPSRTHVPYRDSKLTRLLQDSLGGNAYTLMICCVSPASVNYDETLASLRFAERAKKVKNIARINIDPAAQKIAALMEENRALRARVGVLEGLLIRYGHGDELQRLGNDATPDGGPSRAAAAACCVIM